MNNLQNLGGWKDLNNPKSYDIDEMAQNNNYVLENSEGILSFLDSTISKPSKFKILIIDKEQEQILLGSLLGDGCIIKDKNSYKYCEEHGIKQEKYLLWKNKYLNFNFKKDTKRSNYEVTKSNKSFKLYKESFYPNNKKIVTREILDKLEPLGLAIWFMDDGTYNYRNNAIAIATNCFGLEGNQIIRQYFKEKWDIDCKIVRNNGYVSHLNGKIIKSSETYSLRFNVKDTKNFIGLVKPYVLQIPSMTYKIGLDEEKKINSNKKILEQKRRDYFKNKGKIKERRRAYYQNSKGRLLKQKKEYTPENKEKISIYHKKYYLENKDKFSNSHHIYYLKNRNKILSLRETGGYKENKKEYDKLRHQKNRERNLICMKNYYYEHKDK